MNTYFFQRNSNCLYNWYHMTKVFPGNPGKWLDFFSEITDLYNKALLSPLAMSDDVNAHLSHCYFEIIVA